MFVGTTESRLKMIYSERKEFVPKGCERVPFLQNSRFPEGSKTFQQTNIPYKCIQQLSRRHIDTFFLICPENWIWYLMQIVSKNLHAMTNPIFYGNKKQIIKLSAADLAQSVVKIKQFYCLYISSFLLMSFNNFKIGNLSPLFFSSLSFKEKKQKQQCLENMPSDIIYITLLIHTT